MFVNNNFYFENTTGKYVIVTDKQLADDYHTYRKGAWCDRQIRPISLEGRKRIMTTSDSGQKSAAFKFAAIDIESDAEIIAFCEEYGLIYSNGIDNLYNNDHVFSGDTYSELTRPSEMIGGSIMLLNEFQREVVRMKNILRIAEAIEGHKLNKIIEVLAWFCFDNFYEYDDGGRDSIEPAYESTRFNDAFRRFAKEGGYYEQPESTDPAGKIVRLFLSELITDYNKGHDDSVPAGQRWQARQYADMDHKTWFTLYGLFTNLIEIDDVQDFHPLGGVTLSHPLTDEEAASICRNMGEENIISLARAFLMDFFSTELMDVSPELIYKESAFQPNLSISCLLTAMYIDIFFQMTPHTAIRKCANPTCNAFFQVARSNSKKIYCDNLCAQRMAKRNQRQRESNLK